ncbi:MAG: exonuclease subunit SbcD [Acidimicrobiia bacterium]|nr:exonuclease subunit SbcD [Acidimicrobiia bacterium]
MKVIHTSDWHLGARLGRHARQPDHTAALSGLLALVDAEAPDLILHTGDLFDDSRPPYEALDLAVQALGRLAKAAPTIVLSGNHDSAALFRVLHDLAGFAEPRRLWFVTDHRVIDLDVDELAVAVACVPFIPPTAIADVARGALGAFEGTYADGVALLTSSLLDEAEGIAGTTGVVLYAAHLHVHGAVPGRSEKRISVGDDYATHTPDLHRAVYSGFGHIHDPQLLPGGAVNGRYAGSLIPIDFGEQEQVKQAVIVEIGADVIVRTCPLPGGRPLTRVDGDLATLLARAADGGLDHHLLRARVVSDDPIPDLVDQLLASSPHCDVFDLVNHVKNRTARPIDSSATPDEEPALAQSFAEWRTTAATIGQRKAPDEAVVALLEAVLGAAGDAAPDLGTVQAVAQVDAALDALTEA